ncbi:MAG: HNH endonuclease [Muribaculaceae bacterium]|nr:HNH endonuclease [Muribaculaceae bacterium]
MDKVLLERIWNKATEIEGLNPMIYRKDACGALIMRDKYGLENPFGWVIDHIFPVNRGGDDNFDNLRPLHWRNNQNKDDDYPSYTAVLKYNGNENVVDERNLTVNAKTRQKLKILYNNA